MNDTHNQKPSKKGLYAALAGTALAALCCFTLILVIVLTTVGLGALTPYLDYILLPALAILALVSYLAYRKYTSDCVRCEITNKSEQICCK